MDSLQAWLKTIEKEANCDIKILNEITEQDKKMLSFEPPLRLPNTSQFYWVNISGNYIEGFLLGAENAPETANNILEIDSNGRYRFLIG